MDGDPAGWYDDPDDPDTKRYWDGSTWTDDRAPAWDAVTADTEEPFDPLGDDPPELVDTSELDDAPDLDAEPTDGAAPTEDDRPTAAARPAPAPSTGDRTPLIIAAVIGVLLVIAVIALVAALVSGGDDDVDRTQVVNRIVPGALQQNYADQGLDVTVSAAACNDVPASDGPFSTTCTVAFVGTERTLVATVSGSNTGDQATITGATTDTNLLDEALAIAGAQQLVDAKVAGLTVTACQLAETPLLIADGDQFTCRLENGQTATFTVEDGTFVLSSASSVGP
jgi:hypothetical protein